MVLAIWRSVVTARNGHRMPARWLCTRAAEKRRTALTEVALELRVESHIGCVIKKEIELNQLIRGEESLLTDPAQRTDALKQLRRIRAVKPCAHRDPSSHR